MRSEPKDLASRCQAGRTATPPERRKRWRHPRRGAGSLAALLDSETPVSGVTTGALRPDMASIAVPSTTDGGNMAADDFSVTAGWGHFGQGETIMPGQGKTDKRAYTAEEQRRAGRLATQRPRRQATSRHPPQRPRLLAQRPVGGLAATSWAGTRSSRSGSPTGSAASWANR